MSEVQSHLAEKLAVRRPSDVTDEPWRFAAPPAAPPMIVDDWVPTDAEKQRLE